MSDEPGSFRFGLRGLFLLMTGLALLLGLIIAFGRFLGVTAPFALGMVLSQQLHQLPVYIVWSWGALLLWQRRHVHPLTTKHALIGIGGLASITMGSSLGRLWLQALAMGGAAPASTWMFWWWGCLLVTALANAVFWVFIMKAILRFRVIQQSSAPADAQRTSGTSGLPPKVATHVTE